MSTPRILVPTALDAEGALAFAVAVEQAARDSSSRVICIAGSEGEFCRGLDLAALLGGVGDESDLAARVASGMSAFLRCLRAIREAGKPVMAIVDGPALGGGLGIAAACDVIIATPRATFGLPEALFGLIPAAVLPLILERVPSQKARLLAMTGRTRTAEEALDLGLIDALCAPERLDGAVKRWTRDLSRASTDAVRTLKQFTVDISSSPLLSGVQAGAELTRGMLASGSLLDGIRGYLAGDAAPWLAQEDSP